MVIFSGMVCMAFAPTRIDLSENHEHYVDSMRMPSNRAMVNGCVLADLATTHWIIVCLPASKKRKYPPAADDVACQPISDDIDRYYISLFMDCFIAHVM